MQFSGKNSAFTKFEAPYTWLLVEITNQCGEHEASSNFGTKYLILLPMDLVESETSKTHASGFVRFLHNQRLIEGRVIFSAPYRNLVEEKLQQLTAQKMHIQPIQKKDKYFLVQFSKGCKDIVQTVVLEKEAYWPSGIQPNHEVMIFDGEKNRVATLLHVSDSKDRILEEFQKLKIFSFEKGFDDHDYDNAIADNNWILVLYTCGPTSVVYTILNSSVTLWQRGNRYKDAVAYITDGRSVYQSIILRKSHSFDELLHYLNIIKSSCMTADFPLSVDVDRTDALPPPQFQSYCGAVETFERFAGNKQYALLEQSLNKLEDSMRDEAATLIECMEVLSNAKQILEQREVILRDSINII